jgi:hypothetical protein
VAVVVQDTQPTGVIELNIYEAVSIEDKSKRFRFYLHNNNKSSARVFRLTAPSQMEMVQWVAAISQVLKVCKRVSGSVSDCLRYAQL